MNKLIIAFGLTFAANTAMADAFAPWNDRVREPVSAAVSTATFAPTVFAPWNDRVTVMDPMAQASRMVVDFGSAFRPWHMPS